MKTITTCCLFVVLSALSALGADNAVLTEREAKIEHFALRNQFNELTPLVAQGESDLAAAPSDPAALYFRAFAHYAEASVARAQKDKDEAEKHMNSAVKMLEQIKDPAWEIEAHALQGYIYNQLIGIKGGMSTMKLGPKSSALLTEVGNKAPDNPRVLFFRGVSLVTTPEMWGGDVAQGAKLLERASAAYSQPSAKLLVHWGHAEALAWLGIAKQKAGDVAGARAAWQHALELEPEYGWVVYVLLPSLDQAAVKK